LACWAAALVVLLALEERELAALGSACCTCSTQQQT
jgi:hypothetical protein